MSNPIVKGLLNNPQENSTYCASRRVFSTTEKMAPMWIIFYDYSRSHQIDSPKQQSWGWGTEGAKIWVNGKERKGWKTITVKCPITKFNSGIWYAPTKWMFTAVFTKEINSEI